MSFKDLEEKIKGIQKSTDIFQNREELYDLYYK